MEAQCRMALPAVHAHVKGGGVYLTGKVVCVCVCACNMVVVSRYMHVHACHGVALRIRCWLAGTVGLHTGPWTETPGTGV